MTCFLLKKCSQLQISKLLFNAISYQCFLFCSRFPFAQPKSLKKSKKVLPECISFSADCNSAYHSPTWVASPRTLAEASAVEFA